MSQQEQPVGHEDREACFETKDFLGEEAADPVYKDHGQNVDVIYTCPTCGRKWEYVHGMQGIWDPDAEEYFREGGF